MARTYSSGTGANRFAPVASGAPCTLAAWIRPSAGGMGTRRNLLTLENATSNGAIIGLHLNPNAVCAQSWDGGSNGIATAGTVVAGVWNHAAAIFAGNASRTAFHNGVPGSTEFTPTTPAGINTTTVGAYFDGTSFLYSAQGDLAEVALWSTALTAPEIAALARGVCPLLIRPTSLAGYWPCSGRDLTYELDRWANGHHALFPGTGTAYAEHPPVFYPAQVGSAASLVFAGLQASSSFAFSSAATLTAPLALAAAGSLSFSSVASLTSAPAAFAASSAFLFSSAASLSLAARLAATSSFAFSSVASLVPPSMFASGSFVFSSRATISPSPRETEASITIAGVDVKRRVRMKGLTIHDILNDAPNTCDLVIEGDGPAVGQALRVTMNEGSRVLFAGQVQSVEQFFEQQPRFVAWKVRAIDDTAAANAKRPFGTWENVSASTIAAAITPAGFSQAGIEAGLPPVSITFDGSDTTIAALARLATMIGGYSKIEDATVYLFTEDTEAAPDPIDPVHPFLHAPAIRANVDASQLRTRVYGKGYGENVQADIAPGESLIPVQDGATFPPFGSQAIAASTPDGAQWERLAFAGVERQGVGTLVGPGAGPTIPPVLGVTPGAGVSNGHHEVAVVFVTGSGKSLAGPPAGIDVPTMPPPPSAPVAAAAVAGTGPDQGSHDYAASFVTAFGETTPSPISNAVATSATAGQIAPPPASIAAATPPVAGGAMEDGTYSYDCTFVTSTGETTLNGGPASGWVISQATWPGARSLQLYGIPTGPAGVIARKLYRFDWNTGGPYQLLATLNDNTTTLYLDTKAHSALGPVAPVSNTTGTAVQRIPVSSIPLGGVGVIARRLYRRFNGAGPFKRVTELANNTATTYQDAVPNGALGPDALSSPTAVGNQIAVSGIPLGASTVTARELYMSPVGSSARKLALVIPNNTATTGTITASDATLATAAAEPVADTSGLQQPAGQVNPGSTTIPVAAAATFRSAGGWVILQGGQVVRYAGIAGQVLTGVPAAGPGSITTTVVYGSPAIPSPMLTGATGLGVAVKKGSAIHIWVQRDDLQAQAEQAARQGGGDGVVEYLLVDNRRGLESLTQRVDAELALFARPLVTVEYATRDMKTKSGKQVTISLSSPAIHESLTIQEVTITEIDQVPNVAPRFSVRASSVRFSLPDTIRRLVAGGQIVGGST